MFPFNQDTLQTINLTFEPGWIPIQADQNYQKEQDGCGQRHNQDQPAAGKVEADRKATGIRQQE